MLTDATDHAPVIQLTLDDVETKAHLRSISPSGLAVLGIADPQGALQPLLAQTLDRGAPVHLTAQADDLSVALDASLVWFEAIGQNDPNGDGIELFVDASGSPHWGELLALSRTPRG